MRVATSMDFIRKKLGHPVDDGRIREILASLDFEMKGDAGALDIGVPGYRGHARRFHSRRHRRGGRPHLRLRQHPAEGAAGALRAAARQRKAGHGAARQADPLPQPQPHRGEQLLLRGGGPAQPPKGERGSRASSEEPALAGAGSVASKPRPQPGKEHRAQPALQRRVQYLRAGTRIFERETHRRRALL